MKREMRDELSAVTEKKSLTRHVMLFMWHANAAKTLRSEVYVRVYWEESATRPWTQHAALSLRLLSEGFGDRACGANAVRDERQAVVHRAA